MKTQRNKKHRRIQNHAIRETVQLVKGKVSIFFLPSRKHVFFFLGGNIYDIYGIYFKALQFVRILIQS